MPLFIPVYASVVYRFKGKGYLGILFCGLCFIPIAFLTLVIPHLNLLLLLITVCLILLTVAILKGWFSVRKWIGLLMIYAPAGLTVLLLLSWFNPMRIFGSLFNADTNQFFWNGITRHLLQGGAFVGEGSNSFLAFTDNPIAFESFNRGHRITVLISQYGFWAGILVLLAMTVLLIFLFHNVLKTKNQLGFYISLGIALIFAVESITYFCANFGIIFFSQYELPLLADGKTSTIIHLFLLGTVLSIFKYHNILKEEESPSFISHKKWIEKTEDGIFIRTK